MVFVFALEWVVVGYRGEIQCEDLGVTWFDRCGLRVLGGNVEADSRKWLVVSGWVLRDF